MNLLYVTEYDSTELEHFSGTGHYVAKALEAQGITLERLTVRSSLHHRVASALKKALYQSLYGQTYIGGRADARLKSYARQISARVDVSDVEVVFSPGPIPIAKLNYDVPSVFWTDSTVPGLVNFYPEFSNLSSETLQDCLSLEQSALDRCRLAIYSSDWAARTARENYSVDGGKLVVVPFGANLDSNLTRDEVRQLIRARDMSVCNLLFLGSDWLRKGGPKAVEIVRKLQERGVRSELVIVGSSPSSIGPVPEFVKVNGFADKSTVTGRATIERALMRAHFLLLPTRADCCPVVLAEANSFGVPCITTRIAGVPTAVTDGVNGRMFASSSPVEEYVEFIGDALRSQSAYEELALRSYDEYQRRLNWRIAGRAVKRLLEERVLEGG